MTKKGLIAALVILLIGAGLIYANFRNSGSGSGSLITSETDRGGPPAEQVPLSIEYMRKQEYPGSEITIEQTLPPGSNYSRYIASYKSDGLKIYALLTVPDGNPSASSGQVKPATGWPVIVFNHGYIAPEQYRTTEKYVAYTDAFSRNGYIVFKPDYRGHGNSEGSPEGAYYSPAYTIDVLNAVSSIKKYSVADPNRIGMWGHSMGGAITLRAMVVTKDIKAGVIWGGVVASYQDLATNWHHPGTTPHFVPSGREQSAGRPGRQQLVDKYGSFEQNPGFWNSISPISFVSDISGPVQLDHGTVDTEVPVLFSQKLDKALKAAGKTVELYTYEGDDHNLSGNLTLALSRSVDFFDRYLK
jgi:dipeptidyl aminopeptidase/acylaminoacyl peptidase